MDCKNIASNIVRKKCFSEDLMRNDLRKVLHLWDLTFLAIGSMIGSGLYVFTGTVAHYQAGPSVVLSYLLAALTSVLSSVCYAEFAARIPITGSAYQFTYLSVGEIWAFVVGWNVFLEHAVLAASIAKGWSGYVDGMFGSPIRTYMTTHAPMYGELLDDFPDFLAGALLVIILIVVTLGVKLSSRVNVFFAVLNLSVISFIIATGLYLGNAENWSGSDKFFPHGWSGTISGAATLIFSYVGYEVVASATEESVNPKRDVPLSLFISLAVVVVAYVGASAALTLMVPWQDISIPSPFPSAYQSVGWDWAKYVVSVGALAAMTAAMLSALIVVPRYLFAMARDGLLMPVFEKVNDHTGVPVASTIISGILCIILSIIFSLQTLVEFISIGQLLACTFVAICVIKLRYEPNNLSNYDRLSEDLSSIATSDSGIRLGAIADSSANNNQKNKATEDTPFNTSHAGDSVTTATQYQTTMISSNAETCGTLKQSILQSRFLSLLQWTNKFPPGTVPFYLLLIAVLFASVAVAMLLFGYSNLEKAWFIIIITISIILSISFLLLVTAFNQDQTIKTYKVPLVPFFPFASIVINVILILKLQPLTWLRFIVWMIIGLLIYATYGYRHSKTRKTK